MNFPNRTSVLLHLDPDLGPDGSEVSRGSGQSQAESSGAAPVSEQLPRRGVLGDGEIGATVFVKIGPRRPSLYTRQRQAAGGRGYRSEIPRAIPAQQESAATIQSPGFAVRCE